MISIAICEDEAYTLEKLCEKTKHYIEENELCADIRTYLSGEALVSGGLAFDIILLDLMLSGINGIEVAKRFCSKSQVVFVTAYKEYALDAFDVGAVHYLLKPVTKERLYQALDRAVEQTEKADNKTLTLLKNGKMQNILIRDIIYCEVFDHQICIHTVGGDLEYSGTLDTLEGRLDGRFFRCHRSFLVNMSCVVRQEDGVAFLAGGHKIMISRRRRQEFLQKMLKFLGNEAVL